MLGRVLNAILLGLVMTFPASYLVFDRETTEVESLRDHLKPNQLITTSDGVSHVHVQGGNWNVRMVLIHGGTVPMSIWDDYLGPLEGAGFQALQYDLFGRGLSDRIDGPYDRALHVRQLAELLASLQWDDQPVDLVGYSFGGAVAASFAARYPDRVRNLVLIAPLVDYRDRIPAVSRWPVLGEYFVRVFGVPQAIGRIRGWAEGLSGGVALFDDFALQTETDGFEDLLLSLARTDALGDYRDTYEKVGKLAIPTLLLSGQNDAEIPAEHMAAIRQRIPDLVFRQVPDAGHEIGVSHDRVLLEIMLPWLQRNW